MANAPVGSFARFAFPFRIAHGINTKMGVFTLFYSFGTGVKARVLDLPDDDAASTTYLLHLPASQHPFRPGNSCRRGGNWQDRQGAENHSGQ